MPAAATVSAASNPQLMIRRAVLSLQNFLLQLLFISISLFPYFSTQVVRGPVGEAQARIIGGCRLCISSFPLKTCDVLRKKTRKLKSRQFFYMDSQPTDPEHSLSLSRSFANRVTREENISFSWHVRRLPDFFVYGKLVRTASGCYALAGSLS